LRDKLWNCAINQSQESDVAEFTKAPT
jgi:hypothetical protein